MTSCGAVTLPSRFRHFAPVFVEHEAVGQHNIEWCAAARAAALQKRRLEPAAMLVGAFKIHDCVRAAGGLALDAGKPRKMLRVFQHKAVGRTGIEPDIENVVDLLPAFVAALAEEALASAGLVPGVGALGLESLDDADIHFRIVENLHRTVRLFLDEHRDRHAPGALPRDHPIGAGFDHAGDAVLALCRHPARGPDRRQRTVTQRVVRTWRCLYPSQ